MAESEKYEVLEKIGHGSFGIIRKVRDPLTSTILCRKEISYSRMSVKERSQLQSEFSILSTLRHPNIVGYYHREHLKSSQDLHLYMEYCGGGDLGRYIRELKKSGKRADEGFVWSVLTQLLCALYRCHYGVDPPQLADKLGFKSTPPPRPPNSHAVILHRDLKPENVFLNSANQVKLGDFGLSKLLSSNASFASTYVGTPFYMSPEICSAQPYTLKSDIWSLGCIIYELCTHEPPFNAKTHFDLVSKIKDGKVRPLPRCYSPELGEVIGRCLVVNEEMRASTAELLEVPVVMLMRKEGEVVEMGKLALDRECEAERKREEYEARLQSLEAEKETMKVEIEDMIRREWEVKARLEIDRLVAIEVERLQAEYESEVRKRVEIEVAARLDPSTNINNITDPNAATQENAATNSDLGLSSATSITDLSFLESASPAPAASHPTSGYDSPLVTKLKKARTPFARAQTMFNPKINGTPMDVDMADPSPMSMASLSLSPRRKPSKDGLAQPKRNIFDKASEKEKIGALGERWQNALTLSDSEDEEEDSIHLPASPTRTASKPHPHPFRAGNRPVLATMKTAPLPRARTEVGTASTVRAVTSDAANLRIPPRLRTRTSNPALRSPQREVQHRGLSKIPSSSNLNGTDPASGLGSPSRKMSVKGLVSKSQGAAGTAGELGRMAVKNNFAAKSGGTATTTTTNSGATRGRSLVELAQARAGGRDVSSRASNGSDENTPSSPSRPRSKQGAMMRKSGGATRVTTWDPEKDEMPSPFLARSKYITMAQRKVTGA